jgi:cytochrome P450
MQPSSPVAAASHVNPYSYYASLPDFAYDGAAGLWVASSATVIDEVMSNPHCLVRPATEPVPKAIAGTSAGAVFARLVRMNEGVSHAVPKQLIAQALAALDLSGVAERSAQLAASLGTGHALPEGTGFTGWMFDLPTYAVAALLGWPEADLPQISLWTSEFVRCLSPLSTEEQIARASTAAQALLASFAELSCEGLASDIRHRAALAGWTDDDAIVANLVGLLSQTHEATAGLVGNCIVALLGDPALQLRLRTDAQLAEAFVQDVALRDPPVQSTRRFVAQATTVADVALKPGAVILLLLGAAGRRDDGSALQAAGKLPGFGHGRHACPGQRLALTIAASAVKHLLALPLPLSINDIAWTYAPSVNGRLPQFSAASVASQA